MLDLVSFLGTDVAPCAERRFPTVSESGSFRNLAGMDPRPKNSSRVSDRPSRDELATEPEFIGLPLSAGGFQPTDRKSTRLNSSHIQKSRMPSSA